MKLATCQAASSAGLRKATSGIPTAAACTAVAGEGGNLLLLKYTPAGARLLTRTCGGAAKGEDVGYGVAAAADGSVYVTGDTTVEGQGTDLLLRKHK